MAVTPRVSQSVLHALQVDPQAVHLGEPASAPDDFVHAVRVPARDVPGAQHIDGRPERQVGRLVCVTHHHVGSAVDEFAHLARCVVERFEVE